MSDQLTVTVRGSRPSWARRLTALAAAILMMATAFIATSSTAEAATKYGIVRAVTQKMAGPHLTNYTQSGTYPKGKKVTLTCYTWGQRVSGWGGTSNLWYQTSDKVYVADVDLDTGSNSPITGACSKISLATFVSETRGKTWANIAGTLPGECVSLTSQYLWRVHGIKSEAWGNAVDYRSGGTGGNKLKSLGFKWSTNTKATNGDILVWSGGTYGHIGIYYNGQVYDQNDSRHSPARTANYSGKLWTNGYLGRWSK